MLLLVEFVLVGLSTARINGDRDSIGISRAEESSDTFPIFIASHKPAVTKRFGLRSFVPFHVPRRVSGLFGASSTTYPTSIQHKIPHLAKALGNTRYVTIAQDPTLVHPWKSSSDSWNSPEDNSIAHDEPGPLPTPELIPEHPSYHPGPEVHHPHKPTHAHQNHHEKPQGISGHKTYFPSQRPGNLEAPQDLLHDPGRNPDFSGLPHEYRSPRASREHPQDVEAPVGRHVHHLHYHSRHRHRQSTRHPGSSEEQPTPARVPKDWSINLRYGHKAKNGGCSSVGQDEAVRRHGRQENPGSQPQQQRQPDSGRGNSSRSSQENPSRSSRENQRSSSQEDPSSGGSSGGGGSGGQTRSRQGGQRRSIQDDRAPSGNGWRPNSLSWKSSPKPDHDRRPRYNDLPILRARWHDQPYRSQESRTVPDVQMVHDRPEWEAIEQNFRDYRDPRGRKLVRNNRTTIIEEEFDKSPHQMDFANPVDQNEYRYTGFPGYDHGDWFHRRHSDAPRKSSDFYPSAPKPHSSDLDIEEILSEDEEADVGIVAIGNRAPNATTTTPSRGSSSQDFLMNGELRFPNQNAAGLRELTELLKTVPEKRDDFANNKNGTRAQVVRTTKNIAITRETFVDGRYDDGGHDPAKTVSKTIEWNPDAQAGRMASPSAQAPRNGRVQRTAFASRSNGNFRNSDAHQTSKAPPLSEQTKLLNERGLPGRNLEGRKHGNDIHDGATSVQTMGSRNLFPPNGFGGEEDRAMVRKRIQRIRTQSTVEVLPLDPGNATGIPIYDIPDTSEEDDADYSRSREHDAPYEPSDYKQGAPGSGAANATSKFPRKNASPTTTPRAVITTTFKPVAKSATTRPRATAVKFTRDSAPSPGPGRINSRSESLQDTAVNKKLPSSKGWRSVASSTTPKQLETSRRFLPQKQARTCGHENCQFGPKPFVYQEPVGRTTAVPSVLTTAPPSTPTTMPARRDSVFIREPVQAAAAPPKERRIRRKRKKVTPTPSKETSPMVASVSLSLPSEKRDQTPARQFRKRKASEDEVLDTPVPAATGDEHGEMRVQFHMQGFSGPESYRYGFHTADPYNPLERFEERDGEGRVRGHYSYMDPTGKRVVVNYMADQNGFQIVKGRGGVQGGSGSGAVGPAVGDSDADGNDNNNAADDDNDANTVRDRSGGGDTGPFGADYNENALDHAN